MYYPVKVTDVSLRDGQEDFVLKYLRLEDVTRLLGLLDRAGFYSIDCWGGTTFYAALMELKEDPWERLRKLRRALSHTPIQMILRGRMLVGFKLYHPEVVQRFVTQAAHLGVDIFRVYDTLNDADNMAAAITHAKQLRKQVEATVLVSLNPNITMDDYLIMVNRLVNLGADIICINDSFGVMTPHQVNALVSAYRRYFYQPLRLHLHDNHQAAITCYQEGVRRGAELVDTTVATLSWPYGPPPLESLVFSLGGTVHDPGIDLDILSEVSEYVEFLKEKHHYREPPARRPEDRLGPAYLPGPLKEFIREELIRREARDRQQAAFKEGQQVWGDLGYLPLKGRILEIIGLQAVENVLVAGKRYERLIPAMQDLLRGKSGRLHTPVQPELQRRALAGEEAPAAPAPETEGRLLSRAGLERDEDVLTYSLFPEEAEAFFQWRDQSGPAPAREPIRTATQPRPAAAPTAARDLTLVRKGEEVRASLEGIGSVRNNKHVLFINVQDHTEAIEVQRVAETAESSEYLVTLHGDTYRIKINQGFFREQEVTPILLEINGNLEEFLLKNFLAVTS